MHQHCREHRPRILTFDGGSDGARVHRRGRGANSAFHIAEPVATNGGSTPCQRRGDSETSLDPHRLLEQAVRARVVVDRGSMAGHGGGKGTRGRRYVVILEHRESDLACFSISPRSKQRSRQEQARLVVITVHTCIH